MNTMNLRRSITLGLFAIGGLQIAISLIPSTKAQSTQPAADQTGPASLIGKPAPDFKLPGLDGGTHSLSEVKGNVVVLDFWGVWCVPCHVALPHVDSLYQAQSPHGLKVFAIDNGDDKAKVQQYISGAKLTLPVLLDPDSAGANAYKVDEYPQTVVIGKDGNVKAVLIGFTESTTPAQLEKAVAAAMSQTP
jgi:peroxiredoxin